MKKRMYLILFLFTSITFAQTQEVDSLFQIGYSEFKVEKYDDAIIVFKSIIAIDSLNSKAFEYLGRCFDRKFNTDKAFEYYEKAYELDTENYNILSDLALKYSIKNQMDQSIECYLKYIELNPESEQGYFGLYFIYSSQNNYLESNIYAKGALKRIDVNNREHYFAANYLIAINYYYLNQKDETKKIFIDLLSKDYNISRQDILTELNLKKKN